MKQKLNCIMVIDDDEPTNFMSSMLIGEADCTRHLRMIESGLKALRYLEKAIAFGDETNDFILPDLIFLDINMPCMNGWEFLDEYKKLGSDTLANTVIIMLTTSLNPDDQLRAESMAEIAGFEIKPLSTEMIERLIKTYFNPGLTPVGEPATLVKMNVPGYTAPTKFN